MAENTEGRTFLVEGNDVSGYIGVSPEYQNYASKTEAPLQPAKKDRDPIAERVAEHDKLVAGEPNPAVVEAAAEDRAAAAAAAEEEAKAAAEAAAKEKADAEAAAKAATAKS